MSNNKKQQQKRPFNSASYPSKQINKHDNKGPVEDEEIRNVLTNPEMSTSFSPIVRNRVIPQTNRFSAIKTNHNWKHHVQHNSSYYQPKNASDLSYYQP